MSTRKFTPSQARNISQRTVTPAFDFERAAQEKKLQFDEDEHNIRKKLINLLKWISIVWLSFTAVVITFQGIRWQYFSLSDSVMVAFLTTSLGTVLGLWGIGLGYYFVARKAK